MDIYGIITMVLAIGVMYLLWDTYLSGNIEQVKSEEDNRKYWVQNLPDKKEAADLLAKIRENLILLQGHLEKSYPADPRTNRLQTNFRPNNIMEGEDNHKYTSYSINKGEKIVFCLRKRDQENGLMDINTMMFVALHEYAHIATESTGHTPEFWDNFSWLLLEAMNIGVYKKQDFKNNPEQYCGMQITSSPLDNKPSAIQIPKS